MKKAKLKEIAEKVTRVTWAWIGRREGGLSVKELETTLKDLLCGEDFDVDELQKGIFKFKQTDKTIRIVASFGFRLRKSDLKKMLCKRH